VAYDLAGIEESYRLIMNKEAVQEITGKDDVMLMLVRIEDLQRSYEIKEVIENALDTIHGVSGLTTAVAAEGVLKKVSTVSLMVQAVVVDIAFIVLVVGCIGIVNINAHVGH